MARLLNLDAWREIFVQAFSTLGTNIAELLPKLVATFVLLLIGWLVSRALEVVAARTLRGLGFDNAAGRLRISEMLARAEIRLTSSQIVAKLIFWLVMLTFVRSSGETLGLASVAATIDRLIGFIPGALGAVFIAIGGLLLGKFVAGVVRSAAAAADIASAARLGLVAQFALVGLALMVAAEQLGVATSTLIVPLTVMLAAAGLAIGLAFALGARPLTTHILAGHFLRQSLPRNASIEIDGQRGLVERVGAIDTLLRGDSRVWSIPNGQLLEHVIVRSE